MIGPNKHIVNLINKVMKIKKNLPVLIIIGTLVFIAVWGSKYEKNSGSKNFKIFNESNIEGVIKYVGVQHHGSAFSVFNDSLTYIFYPYTDPKLNSNKIFDYFAKRGDTVKKVAYSDTLYLFKNDKVYRYTFQKFNSK